MFLSSYLLVFILVNAYNNNANIIRTRFSIKDGIVIGWIPKPVSVYLNYIRLTDRTFEPIFI